MSTIEKIVNLTIENRVSEALDSLSKLENHSMQARMMKTKYNRLLNEQIEGTITDEKFSVSVQKICKSIYLICDKEQNAHLNTESDQLSQILDELKSVKSGQVILLQQQIENHNLLFTSLTEQKQFINRFESYLKTKDIVKHLPDDWADRKIKDKIKISIPFIVGKIEREYDISGITTPKNWNEFKRIFIR